MEPIQNAQLLRLYKPVGEITVLWGMIDHMVHFTGFAMIKYLGSKPDDHGGWPIMMGARTQMIDKLFRHKDFEILKEKWKFVYKSLRHLQDLRDYLVHGAASRYDTKKDAVLFVRIDRATNKQQKRQPEFSHNRTQMLVRFTTLEQAVRETEDLARNFEDLRREILALKP